ncbi:MAG: glycosyltransferase [Methanobacteriaceae archaeon]|nr:glycosyltransferase [Methanobacteriaceae archaeon]
MLIDKDTYLNTHNTNNLDYILHYIYFGSLKDDISLKKEYINPIFDLDFYKGNYLENSSNDPLIDYVSSGFFKNYFINYFDKGYIENLNDTALNQFYLGFSEAINEEFQNNYYLTDKKLIIPYIESNEIFKTDTIKVGVFLNDTFENLAPCPYLRIHEPLKELSKSNKFHFFIYGMDSYHLMDFNKILNSKVFDIIIVERILPFLDILVDKALKHGIKLIYETDDDLLSVEENSPSFEYVDRCRNEITNYINNSDIIVTATDNLARRFNKDNVEVIKNYHVDSLLPIKDYKENNSNSIKIGYFGTKTHSKDLAIVKNVFKKLKSEIKTEYDIDVVLEIIGGFNEDYNEDWFSKIELPENSMDFEFFMKWIYNKVDWDIGIAPLEDSYFNNGKSELKYIEFSALGIPGVFSNIEVYNSVVKDGINGFLASNDEEWFEKLKKLIIDKNLRKEILSNSQENILNSYSLVDRVKQWEKILINLSN